MTDLNQNQALLAGKRAGIGLHFTSLSSAYGIGDIANSALSFIDKLDNMGIGVWQFLPTGPTAYGDSPYQPLSAFANNEMLIGIEPLLELGFLTATEVVPLTELPADRVDYGVLIPLKKALIERAAERFSLRANSALKDDYETFLNQHNQAWLHDYAVYRVIKSMHDEQSWLTWDDSLAHRDSSALQKLTNRKASQIEAIKVAQFLFWHQWRQLHAYAREKDIVLFGDMPIYIALDSSDAWAHPEMLRFDEQGQPTHISGVPPDYFSQDGQLWGNPLYDWDYHEKTGYQWWVNRIQHSMAMMDTIKIDHFRGFESYWAVPFGAEHARKGTWDAGPADALFEAIRTKIGTVDIVAENLGVITDEVEALRHRYNIPGMHVLQFDVSDPDFDLKDITEDSVCYTGTHDNDTTVGWFFDQSDDTRSAQEVLETQRRALKITKGRPKTIHLDMIRLAFASNARIAIAPMQDFLGLGSEARINTPGTTSDNWRWRVTADQLSQKLCDQIHALVQASGRDRQPLEAAIVDATTVLANQA